MKEFFTKHQNQCPDTIYLEYPFNLKINGGGETSYTIHGRVDRIDRAGEGIKIIDYKTGKPKEKLAGEDKEQLLIYQLAAEQVMKEKVKEVAYYYVEANQEISFLGEPKELDKLKNKIIATIEEIKKGDFPPYASAETCKWCDFNKICEFRK